MAIQKLFSSVHGKKEKKSKNLIQCRRRGRRKVAEIGPGGGGKTYKSCGRGNVICELCLVLRV
jgi:hypothetical protein